MAESELLLRPATAALLLGCSRSFVYALIAAGRLPAVRLGGRAVRVHRSKLVEFLEAQATLPKAKFNEPALSASASGARARAAERA